MRYAVKTRGARKSYEFLHPVRSFGKETVGAGPGCMKKPAEFEKGNSKEVMPYIGR